MLKEYHLCKEELAEKDDFCFKNTIEKKLSIPTKWFTFMPKTAADHANHMEQHW